MAEAFEATRELATSSPSEAPPWAEAPGWSEPSGEATSPAAARASIAPEAKQGRPASLRETAGSHLRLVTEVTRRAKRGRRREVGLGQIAYAALLLSTLGLLAFGLVMVFSASSVRSALTVGDEFTLLKRQGAFAVAGLLLLAILARIDLGWIRRAGPPLLVISFLLLVAVLIVATPVNGAKRWLSFGPVGVQPSEVAKLALALWLALYLARKEPPRSFRALLSPIGIVVLTMIGLVLIAPDLGTAIVIGMMVAALLHVGGTPMRLLLVTAAGAAAVIFAAVWLEPWRRERFTSFLDPWADPEGAGFQSVQALIAIGSGGVFGRGLGESVQKIYYLPEASTDMIFAVIAEELGLVGALFLVGLYAVFVWAGFTIAVRSKDQFAKALAIALTVLVGGQALLNLSAVMGIAPLTGLPLPFVSYGGSHLIVSLAAVGILLNIAQANGRAAGASTSVRDRRWRNRRSRPARAGRRRRPARAGRPRVVRGLA